MDAGKKVSIPRVLVLLLIGFVFLAGNFYYQYQRLSPLEQMSVVKRTCTQLHAKVPGLAKLFHSCQEIWPGSVNQFVCGSSYFPPEHYCNSVQPGCKAQYFIVAVNPDSTVECSCRVSCEQAPPFVVPAKPGKPAQPRKRNKKAA